MAAAMGMEPTPVSLQMNVPVIPKETLEIHMLIGRGAFGAVYKARSKTLFDSVAVKVVCNEAIMQHREARKFEEEASKMFSAHYRFIIQLHGVCMTPGYYALITEYCHNGSVGNLLELIEVPWPLRLRILLETALGLNYLHTMVPVILHLDLKSQNVLLTSDFHVKICDFGMSKWRHEDAEENHVSGNNSLGGTITHMPPEAMGTQAYAPNKPFDLYSFGIYMWEVITRQRPYQYVDNKDVIKACVIKGQRPDTRDVPEACPREITELMQCCWSCDPLQRPTIADCLEVIEPKTVEDVPQSINFVKEEKRRLSSSHVDLTPGSRRFESRLTLDDAVSLTFHREFESQHDSIPEVDAEPDVDTLQDKGDGNRRQTTGNHGDEGISSNSSSEREDEQPPRQNIVNITDSQGIHIGDNFNQVIHINQSATKESRGNRQARDQSRQVSNPYGAIDSRSLMDIANNIGNNWRGFGRHLGLIEGELDALHYDYRVEGLKEICYQMLRKWVGKNGHKANRSNFASVCLKAGRQDLVSHLG